MADDKRILLKRATTTGTAPSVPTSNDHTDGTWTATDCYVGEVFTNTTDGRMYLRVSNAGFIELSAAAGVRRTIEIVEDFFGYIASTTSGNIYKYDWTAQATGAGAAITASTTEISGGGKAGIVRLETGTTNTGVALIDMQTYGIDGYAAGILRYEWYIKIPTLSTGAEEFTINVGLMDSSSSITDGIYFTYDRGRNTDWLACVAENGAETATDTNAPVSTSWVRLAILTTYDWSSIYFYINDVLVHTETGTNIPISSGSLIAPGIAIEKSAGTTTRYVYADYFYLRRILASAR